MNTPRTPAARSFPVVMLLLAVLVLATSSVLSWWTASQLAHSINAVGETQRVIERIHRYWGMLGDRDSAILRYMLNGLPRYLDEFRETLAKLEETQAQLRRDVDDDPVQRAALDRLDQLHRDRIARADELITLRKAAGSGLPAQGSELHLQLASVPASRNAADMRAVLDGMIAHEKRERTAHREGRERVIAQTRAMIVAANTIAVVAGLLALLAVRNRRRHEDEAMRAAMEAEQARRVAAERQSALEIVAHDLRGHFGNLLFASDLLPDATDADRRRTLARSIRGSAASGLLFLRAVLEQAAGETRGEPVTVLDPADTLARLVDEAADIARARALHFDLRVDPDLRLRGQALALDHVLRNLLSNALKFAPADSAIEIVGERLEDRGRLRVMDRGPGVPEARRSELFQRYAPLSPEPADAPSTGLGLALARQHARAQGGELRYLPRDGGGACFQVEWPLA